MIILRKKELKKILKISSNFLMVDSVKVDKKKKKAVGKKKFNNKVWFFKDHFINEPVMPGSLQIEAMLQTTVSMLYLLKGNNNNKILISKETTTFFNKINCEGQLDIESEITCQKKGLIEVKSQIQFKKKMISESIFRYVDPSFF
jgi:3-hydroxymyristoyl/3-hydroxydecanoyl-(acyl carrier protein) dehydratase